MGTCCICRLVVNGGACTNNEATPMPMLVRRRKPSQTSRDTAMSAYAVGKLIHLLRPCPFHKARAARKASKLFNFAAPKTESRSRGSTWTSRGQQLHAASNTLKLFNYAVPKAESCPCGSRWMLCAAPGQERCTSGCCRSHRAEYCIGAGLHAGIALAC